MRSSTEEDPAVHAAPAAPYPLLLLFLAFTLTVVGVFYVYHRTQTEAIEREARKELLAVADMKVEQIDGWRQARVRVGQSIMADAMSMAVMRSFLARRGAAERVQILKWLDAICTHGACADAILTDAQGRVALTVGRAMGDDEYVRGLVAEVLQGHEPVWHDFRRDGPNGPVHLGLNIPLRLGSGPPFGALLFGIDPENFLYPLIRGWPTRSLTAESFLVRRDGDDILHLSDLRGHPGMALNERIPLTRSDVPAVRAVLGARDDFEGPDFGGVSVFAAARAVPGTPWFLVAKINAQEVRGPIARRAIPGAIAAVALILAFGGVVAFFWRREQTRFYRDRYHAEVERRALLGRYDYLSRFANDAILLMDEAGHILEANDRALEMYGYTREEFLALSARDMVHPSDRADFEVHWNAMRGRKSSLFEKVHAHRDGTALPVEVSVRIIEVEGKVFRQSIIRDISERRRAQAALRESDERFRQVVESAPEGIIVEIDVEGVRRMRYLNPVALRLLGAHSASQLLGRPVAEMIHPDELELGRRRAASVLQGGYVAPTERRFRRLYGGELLADTTIARLDFEGKPALLIFLHDLSERKRVEAEHALLEAQLRQAQKMESVGRLAGGVAHDFNNLLTVINGYCDMLLAGFSEGDPARESLDEIRAAGERAASLTQQLLAFSRKQVAEPQPMSLNEVVADSGGMLRRIIGADIEIATSLADDPAVVIADRGQMNQVLMNLAVNARDAMPEGGKLVIETQVAEIGADCASLPADARPGRFVVLSVSDTGVGMGPEVLHKIFEPFFTTKAAGTGLGLATVYGIVRQSGGWVTAESEPGRGACFRVYLAAAAPCPAEPECAVEAQARDSRGSETLLVVEDHPEVLRLTRAMLRQRGYRLLEAATGAEALAVAAAHAGPIDALVTDVVMPGMNGRELAARLLQLRPDVKVLYTSGYAGGAIGSQGVLEPGIAYLAKPFTAAQLTLKLRQVIEEG